ncbi:MAG: Xaa-Pro peptidase family protein [Candidatus Altiarchaeota archaeon]
MGFSRELQKRVRGVQERLESGGVDALYVSNPKNVLYLTGRESGRLLLTKRKGYLWVRNLYKELYSDLYSSKGYPCEVKVYRDMAVVDKVKFIGCRRLGVDNVSLSYYNTMRRRFKCRLKPAAIVEEERAVKTDYEMDILRKSASTASKAMRKAYEVVKSGVREMDAVAEIECYIRKMGSETPPFNEGMHLAFGVNSSNIHAYPTKQIMKRGLVIVDLGARIQGYYSDMTRTMAVGRLSSREKGLKNSVRSLEFAAVDMIQPGMKASEVHEFISSELEKKGFEFHHAAGHGVGLEVHEKPSISPESQDTFKEGMVFTIEPGVYIPKKFGVRFEDMVVLTKKGCRMLTKGP